MLYTFCFFLLLFLFYGEFNLLITDSHDIFPWFQDAVPVLVHKAQVTGRIELEGIINNLPHRDHLFGNKAQLLDRACQHSIGTGHKTQDSLLTVHTPGIADSDADSEVLVSLQNLLRDHNRTIAESRIAQTVSKGIQGCTWDILIETLMMAGTRALVIIDRYLSRSIRECDSQFSGGIYTSGKDGGQWRASRRSGLPHLDDGIGQRFHMVQL